MSDYKAIERHGRQATEVPVSDETRKAIAKREGQKRPKSVTKPKAAKAKDSGESQGKS